MYSPAKNKVSTFIHVTTKSNTTRSKHLIHKHEEASYKSFPLQPLSFPANVTTFKLELLDYIKCRFCPFYKLIFYFYVQCSSIQV
ncbi:hypothetical protein HanPSC8_Chr11g0457381 [Helianthus annuus]|nr:hypothetical protein HanPSC8_Chr11g0457381 [Helianthus annuus]